MLILVCISSYIPIRICNAIVDYNFIYLIFVERAQLIKQGNLQLLAELLFNAQRIDLMRKIRMKPSNLELMIEENGPLLKPYR